MSHILYKSNENFLVFSQKADPSYIIKYRGGLGFYKTLKKVLNGFLPNMAYFKEKDDG